MIDQKYQMELKTGNITVGAYAHAEGMGNDVIGDYSHAEGCNTTSNGGYGSHAEGLQTQANGEGSHAEGEGTQANASDSHAEGIGTQANANFTHAEGQDTRANGQASHAEGEGCVADGVDCHVEGRGSYAYGVVGHAEGDHTIANAQHTEGRYNIEDEDGDYAHIVGNGYWDEEANNGEGEEVRSNAHTIDWSGNGWFGGDVYVGSTSGTNKDSGSKKLATEDYVDSLVVDGAKKTILYNGKANSTAILSGAIQELSDSIFNYDLIIVGFNCMVQNVSRSMEICDTIYPNSSLITWCDATGAGATGAHHIYNGNQTFNNVFRVMWGFTDATHIRNIVASVVNSGNYPWVDAGICYVIGYKFSSLPDGYATEQYVDNAIASSITSAIGGSY